MPQKVCAHAPGCSKSSVQTLPLERLWLLSDPVQRHTAAVGNPWRVPNTGIKCSMTKVAIAVAFISFRRQRGRNTRSLLSQVLPKARRVGSQKGSGTRDGGAAVGRGPTARRNSLTKISDAGSANLRISASAGARLPQLVLTGRLGPCQSERVPKASAEGRRQRAEGQGIARMCSAPRVNWKLRFPSTRTRFSSRCLVRMAYFIF